MTDFIVGAGSFVMGVLYPSYQSFKAIRTQDNKEDDTQVDVVHGLPGMLCMLSLVWLGSGLPIG
jgi:hypothetical protein